MLRDLAKRAEELAGEMNGKIAVACVGGEVSEITAGLADLLHKTGLQRKPTLVVMDKSGFTYCMTTRSFPSHAVRLLVLVGNWLEFRNADCLYCSGGKAQYVSRTSLTSEEIETLRENILEASRLYRF